MGDVDGVAGRAAIHIVSFTQRSGEHIVQKHAALKHIPTFAVGCNSVTVELSPSGRKSAKSRGVVAPPRASIRSRQLGLSMSPRRCYIPTNGHCRRQPDDDAARYHAHMALGQPGRQTVGHKY